MIAIFSSCIYFGNLLTKLSCKIIANQVMLKWCTHRLLLNICTVGCITFLNMTSNLTFVNWNEFRKGYRKGYVKTIRTSQGRGMFTLLHLIVATSQPFAYIEQCVWYIALLLIHASRILGFWILSRNTTLFHLIITTSQPFAYIEQCVWYIAPADRSHLS